MKYASMIARFNNSLWAATPATMEAVFKALTGSAPMKASSDDGEYDLDEMSYDVGPVRVIRCYGIIGRNLSSLEMMCGGIDVNTIRGVAEKAESDPLIQTVIFDWDSPGGVVHGIPELAAYIRGMTKQTIAWTGGMCASAGYYVASACDVVSCAASADVGSVGVYMAWIDHSKRMEREGDELIVIKAGTEKAAFLDGQLNDTARAALQESADDMYNKFKSFILASGRTIDDQYLQGMSYNGSKALEIGMVDVIHETIETLITEVLK